MVNLTLSVPESLRERMREHESVRWSSVVRSVIKEQLDAFEEAERLVGKSRLTEADAAVLARKADSASGRHARALLRGES